MAVGTYVAPTPALPWPARIAGLAAIAVGVALTLRHALLFQRLDTNIYTFNDPDLLVRDGAFAWTRNPMYLGFVLFLTGLAIGLGSVVAFIGPLVFFVAADRWYIPFEERRMHATFGADYERYRQTVRRWMGRRSTA